MLESVNRSGEGKMSEIEKPQTEGCLSVVTSAPPRVVDALQQQDRKNPPRMVCGMEVLIRSFLFSLLLL